MNPNGNSFVCISFIEINIWKRNSTVEKFPIRPELRSVFNTFDQSFDLFLLSHFLCGISLPYIYFYDFVQHALKKQPTHEFMEHENVATPYSATVSINNLKYETGWRASKINPRVKCWGNPGNPNPRKEGKNHWRRILAKSTKFA
jgi:hypothetical protein